MSGFLNRNKIVFSVFIALLILGFFPINNQLKVSLLVMFTILLWATSLIAEWLTALIFLTLCCVLKLAPVDIVLSGFISSAAWLVVSGIIISAAIVHTGLGYSIASMIYPLFIGSGKKSIVMSTLFGLIASFIMPSAMNRIILLLPILDSVAHKLGYLPENKGYKGIIMAGVLGTYLPASAILPANVPNNVLLGLIESIYHVTPTYTDYFLLHFPVLGALKTLIIMAVIAIIYHDKPVRSTMPKSKKIKPEEKYLAGMLLCATVLWLTEPWHKISVAWISMLVAVFCLYPGCNFLPENHFKKLNLSSFFYVSSIVSMGAVAYHSGIASQLATWLFELLPVRSHDFTINFFRLSALSTLVGLVVTTPGVPGVLTPMTDAISKLTALPVDSVYMLQVIGFSTVFFVYQAPPLVVAAQSGKFTVWELSKLCFIIAVISVILLWPLDLIWWNVIKLF